MRTIEVDFDVHKLIEMERRGFDDPPNAALRRLLGLADPQASQTLARPDNDGWRGEGVHLPTGTQLRMIYSGHTYVASIDGARWVSDGETFNSPSGAASGLSRTKSGKRTRLDGWNYWEAKQPGADDWIKLSVLRRRAHGSFSLEDLEL